jgi:hypothetical protein
VTTFYWLRFETPPTWRASPRIYIPQEYGGPAIPPRTGFPFRRLLRFSALRLRYSTPSPQGRDHSSAFVLVIRTFWHTPPRKQFPTFPLLFRVACWGSHVVTAQPIHWRPGRCLTTVVVLSFVSRSLLSNGSTRYIAPSLRLFVPSTLEAYRHFSSSASCDCDVCDCSSADAEFLPL